MHSARAIVDELGHATVQVLHHLQWETELEDGGISVWIILIHVLTY